MIITASCLHDIIILIICQPIIWNLLKKTAVLTCHVPNRTCMPALPRHYISITFNYMQIRCQFTLCLNFLRSTNAKNRTDITANTAPTNPIYDIAPLSHTIPPIQLPPPIPRLKSPEYMAVASHPHF